MCAHLIRVATTASPVEFCTSSSDTAEARRDITSDRGHRLRPAIGLCPSLCVRVTTRKARTLSKIVIDQESETGDTTLSAQLDDTHVPPTFAELGVREDIVRSLTDIGIERTFAIQELTLPLALAGDDLIGQARTGMGKTFGFGVPLLHRITTPDSGTTPLDGTPRALIIVPTRELCVQVSSDLSNAAKHLKSKNGPVEILSIYGGRPYESQISALQKGVDVVVGTPGRLLDLAKQGHLILGKVGVLVLDEADEMLDLGFLPDIERILGMVPDRRQTMLFSATMPGPIITLARTFLTQPTHIRAEEAESSAVHDRTAQHIYRAHALDKVEMVSKVLQANGRGATMIFTRTKRTAQKVADELLERGFAVGAVHGDLGQIQREKALEKFRTGGIDVRRNRRRCPRYRHRRRHSRHQLPVPGGREDLRAPHRADRSRRSNRNRSDARRLGRYPSLAAHRQGSQPRHPGPGGDVFELAAPVRGTRHTDRCSRFGEKGSGTAVGEFPRRRSGARTDRSDGRRAVCRCGDRGRAPARDSRRLPNRPVGPRTSQPIAPIPSPGRPGLPRPTPARTVPRTVHRGADVDVGAPRHRRRPARAQPSSLRSCWYPNVVDDPTWSSRRSS